MTKVWYFGSFISTRTNPDGFESHSNSLLSILQQEHLFANFSKMNSSPNSEEGRIINAWNDLKQEAGIINIIKVSVSWVLDFRFWQTIYLQN